MARGAAPAQSLPMASGQTKSPSGRVDLDAVPPEPPTSAASPAGAHTTGKNKSSKKKSRRPSAATTASSDASPELLADVLCSRARLLILQGDYDGAEEAYRAALKEDLNSARAHVCLGQMLWFVRGDRDGAWAEIFSAIAADPATVRAYVLIAMLVIYRGFELIYNVRGVFTLVFLIYSWWRR